MKKLEIKTLFSKYRGTFIFWLVGTIFAGFTMLEILNQMGILTIKSTMPTSSIHFKTSSQGNFTDRAVNKRSSQIWEKDETQLAGLNMKFDRLSFRRLVSVKSRSIIIVTLSAGCISRWSPKTETNDKPAGAEKIAMVMTRISFNNKESARDNNFFNSSFSFPLHSSTVYMGALEEGKYPLMVEGIFCGNISDHNASMSVLIIQYADLPYEKIMKLRVNGHKTIINGFTDVGELQPSQDLLKKIQNRNLRKTGDTAAVTKQS